MNKSQLKEVIQNIVAQKLQEAKTGKPAQYGYIIADKDTENPRLQLIGYGNAPTSNWKQDVLRRLDELKKKIELDDWKSAEYMLRGDGMLYSIAAMMNEVFTDPKLKEALETNSAAAANPTIGAAKTPQQRDQAELDKLQKQLDDVTNEIKSTESNIAKRMDAVNKANKKDELQKQQLTKRQGPIIKKMDQLKKKIATYNTAASKETSSNEEK